ncbi:hypothetical protein KAS41_02250 [Candidatus Parcubacteria bacterium]|nr:hypothetical protein [Candidatus Parcubacteria bacterium]
MDTNIQTKQKIEIPIAEYNLLRGVYKEFKKQALLFRIVEAEENLKKKKVKRADMDKFIENI